MTVRQEVDRFTAGQRRMVRVTVAGTAAVWRSIEPDRIVDSWAANLDTVVGQVSAGQTAAAQAGADYVPAVLAAQGVDASVSRVNPQAFAGVASDGRPLETLLALPAHQAVGRIAEGQAARPALRQGFRQFGLLVATQVADAGRLASGVGMTSERQVGGYRRQLTPPSCGRCAVLAGKWFKWNQGFQRHPGCDCVHVPAVGPNSDVAGLETFDPDAYFDSLDPAQQERAFTKSGAQAIRDGADVGQVVNARRGMKMTSMYGRKVSTTTVGTSTRGSAARIMQRETDAQFRKVAGQRYRRLDVPRLTPEQIYSDAKDRDDAIRLLGRFGYLKGSSPPLR